MSVISKIREKTKSGALDDAKTLLAEFLNRKFPFSVCSDSIVFDLNNAVALNSLRAQFKTDDGQHLFLKCHHEENEDSRLNEYYRAGILEDAGFPIDCALYQASEVGEQVVLYNYQDRQATPELHDVAKQIDAGLHANFDPEHVLKAYAAFQRHIGQKYIETLHNASQDDIQKEAIHALFYRRLIDQDNAQDLGGRIISFYKHNIVPVNETITVSFAEFWDMQWVINGSIYPITIKQALYNALKLLNPSKLGPGPALTAHGDDHTANLLYDPNASTDAAIKYFDPAFAGIHIPALLGPCKATYHCVFAHPHMLYDPEDFEGHVDARINNDRIYLDTSWTLPDLRKGFLDAQLKYVWQPLIQHLNKQNMLNPNWEDIVRSALFCCPVLCKNLIAGKGFPNPLTPATSMLTFALAIQLATAPQSGHDDITEFFNGMTSV